MQNQQEDDCITSENRYTRPYRNQIRKKGRDQEQKKERKKEKDNKEEKGTKLREGGKKYDP